MREALGNTFIVNVVLTIVIVIIAVVISSLSYTKAYKVKNMIINAIEENNGFTNDAKSEIEANLKTMGYRINRNGIQSCVIDNNSGETSLTDSNSYRYCVVQRNTTKGIYYRVTSYMYFDFPIIGDRLEFPVYGETKLFYRIDA